MYSDVKYIQNISIYCPKKRLTFDTCLVCNDTMNSIFSEMIHTSSKYNVYICTINMFEIMRFKQNYNR